MLLRASCGSEAGRDVPTTVPVEGPAVPVADAAVDTTAVDTTAVEDSEDDGDLAAVDAEPWTNVSELACYPDGEIGRIGENVHSPGGFAEPTARPGLFRGCGFGRGHFGSHRRLGRRRWLVETARGNRV